MKLKTALVPAIFVSLFSLLCVIIGITIGLNTNEIRYIEASAYYSPEHNYKSTENGELTFTKFPLNIFYSQGDEAGSEKKVETRIFAATGVLTQSSKTVISGNGKEVFATAGFTSFTFQAFIAKGDSGTYSSALTVIHPENGAIELSDGEIMKVSGPQSAQEELKEVAKLILSNL